MTPQQHIDMAEQLLARAVQSRLEGLPDVSGDLLLTALVHAVVALAVEGGVPHAPVVAGGS